MPAKHTSLKEYQVQNADDLVQRLYEMYFEGEPRPLCRFGDIISEVIRYRSQLPEVGRR